MGSSSLLLVVAAAFVVDVVVVGVVVVAAVAHLYCFLSRPFSIRRMYAFVLRTCAFRKPEVRVRYPSLMYSLAVIERAASKEPRQWLHHRLMGTVLALRDAEVVG